MSNVYKYGFPPIVDENATILILGSLPSERSLHQSEYYAHPQNQFWRIVCKIFDEPLPTDYQNKKAMLKRNSIALWDVIQFAQREGSLDADIKNEETNDFYAFLMQFPKIKKIVLNGDKAAKTFHRNFKEIEIETITVPSSSPARANLTVEQKTEIWREALVGGKML